MAKIDKQMLLKQHFWILLGTFALFVLIALIVVPLAVGGLIADKESAIDKMKKELAGQKGDKNNNYINVLKSQNDEVSFKRKGVWEKSYRPQKDLLQPPADVKAQLAPKYFGDEIDQTTRDEFRKENVYSREYENMVE